MALAHVVVLIATGRQDRFVHHGERSHNHGAICIGHGGVDNLLPARVFRHRPRGGLPVLRVEEEDAGAARALAFCVVGLRGCGGQRGRKEEYCEG